MVESVIDSEGASPAHEISADRRWCTRFSFLSSISNLVSEPISLRRWVSALRLPKMDVIDNMLDLTRRLPPNNIEQNLAALVELQPDYADDLLGSVDQPLKVRTDPTTGRDYLICDYNRDGESYRFVHFILVNTRAP